MTKFLDLTGQIFGKWTVIKRLEGKHRRVRWIVKCSCGVIKNVESVSLTTGESKSCGKCRERPTRDSDGTLGFDGKRRASPEYRAFANAKNRCNNPNNKNYLYYGGQDFKRLWNPETDK